MPSAYQDEARYMLVVVAIQSRKIMLVGGRAMIQRLERDAHRVTSDEATS